MISTHQVRDLEQLIDAVVIVNNAGIALIETVAALADRYVFGPCDPNDLRHPPIYTERAGGVVVGGGVIAAGHEAQCHNESQQACKKLLH